MAGRFDSFKASAALVGVCLVSGAIGLVWLSQAVYQFLLLVTVAPVAAGLVAAMFLVAPALIIIARAVETPRPAEPLAAVGGQGELVALITGTAEKMAPATPLTAIAFAITGGALSVHVPSAVTPLILRIIEQLPRHAGAPPDETNARQGARTPVA
jgi:hypothetical protein